MKGNTYQVYVAFKIDQVARTEMHSTLSAHQVRHNLAEALMESGAIHIGDMVFDSNEVLFFRVYEEG